MASQHGIHKGIAGKKQIENRTVIAKHIQQETDRLLKHRRSQAVTEGGKACTVHGADQFEIANLQPVTPELHRQGPAARVLQHPPRLRFDHSRLMQVACRSVPQEFRIRHARPQEIAQSAGQIVIRKWLNSTTLRVVDPISKPRRHQDQNYRLSDRPLMVQGILLPGLAIERKQIRAIRLRQRSSIRTSREIEQRLQMTRLSLTPRLLDPSNAPVRLVEEVFDRPDRCRAAALRERQIVGFEFPDFRLRDNLIHLYVTDLGLAVLEVVPRPASAQLGEFNIRADIDGSNKVHLPPHLVQSRLLLLVQQQLRQRLVVAEVPHHVVESRTQISAFIFARPEVVPPPRLLVEHIRKHAAETRPRRFVPRALTSRNKQLRIAGLVFHQNRLARTERILPFGLNNIGLAERGLARHLQLPQIELSAVRCVLRILPDQQRLPGGADGARRDIDEARLYLRPYFGDIRAHLLTARARHISLSLPGSRPGPWQRSPHRLQLHQRPGILSALQRPPDRLQIPGTHTVLPGQIRQRCFGLPQRRTMPEAPRRLKIIGVVDILLVIKPDDLLHRELVAVGLRQHWMRREGKSLLFQIQVRCRFTRSRQILSQQRRRHAECLTGIVKTRRVGRIDGELTRRPNIHARKIPYRVVVFGIAQPSRQHHARVPGVTSLFVFANGTEPLHGRTPLRRRRMQRALRRHLLRFQPRQNLT